MALVSIGRRSDASMTLVAASLGFSVVQLDVTIVNTALDSIAKALSGSVSTLQWIVTAYTLTFAASSGPRVQSATGSARKEFLSWASRSSLRHRWLAHSRRRFPF
jgi:MFS family permease